MCKYLQQREQSVTQGEANTASGLRTLLAGPLCFAGKWSQALEASRSAA
jgi:hypothetical protein